MSDIILLGAGRGGQNSQGLPKEVSFTREDEALEAIPRECRRRSVVDIVEQLESDLEGESTVTADLRECCFTCPCGARNCE